MPLMTDDGKATEIHKEPVVGKTKQKVIRVIRDLGDGTIVQKHAVIDFDITYDARDVLKIGSHLDPNMHIILYGPGTWKYVELTTEDIP